MAGSGGARGALSAHTLLFDLPPTLLGELCAVLDSCDGALGWRGLAERLSSSWLDVRHIEKYVDQGKSGTRELLWSWAQKNKTEKKMQCQKHWKRFLSELEVLLLFHHPNILELAAYFTETEKFCLVYPYMRNGTLFDRLQCVGNTAPLSWHLRISILIGISKAIHYLHNTQPCSIICGSISSTNILLDDQFQPKLTDFAMAHFRPHLEHQNSTINMTSNSSKHLWYMPEEYIRQGKLSIKTDVYSFGIVIMEVLTGCRVVLDDPKHIQLRDLLMELMEKRGLDSCLSFLDKKVPPCPRNFSAKLFCLAGQCAARQAKLRPSMDEVLNTLECTQASLYFAEDPPTSLKSFRCPSLLFLDNVRSIPVEDDENQNNHSLPADKVLRKDRMAQKTPFECSQSEVTFLGLDRKTGGRRNEEADSMPSASCAESWFPKHVVPSQDLRAHKVHMDPSSEGPGHSDGSGPVETTCCSEFSWNEYEQYKKE
ncbi:PREDICTED: interleukin-1 receptor-associated kinase 3 [Propithecus coquereli]|uniref:interleukin-1 receptor-associated kinase 3 n=1 Tax=Propithecus coquereli TaxID=379532 RepID=UPI00063EF311|nr:PREDICTED: interleukin-1 receptor-associated kinase 3 [Propithecus coquereli]